MNNWHLLLRLQLQRNKWRYTIWLVALSVTSISVAAALYQLFPTMQERNGLVAALKNPAMIAMIGPSQGFEHYTSGAMFAHEMMLFTAIIYAICAILLTTNQTREEEEDGQLELLRARPIATSLPLIITLCQLTLFFILLAIITTLGLTFLHIPSMDVASNALYSFSLSGIGLLFTTLTTVIAQLVTTARGTVGSALALLGVMYVWRGITDISNEKLSIVSPLAWSYLTNSYVTNTWLPIVYLLICSSVFIGIAFWLNAKRDIGEGFIRPRTGHKNASYFLRQSLGWQLRLQYVAIISWGVAFLLLGTSYGSVFNELDRFFEKNKLLQQMLATSSAEQLAYHFLAMIGAIMAILTTVAIIQLIFRLHKDEVTGRLDLWLSRPLSRMQLLGERLVISGGSGMIFLILTTTGLFLGSRNMANPMTFTTILKSQLIHLPAIICCVALATLLLGALPRFKSVIWYYLIIVFFIDYFGDLLQLPEWLRHISLFYYLPALPLEKMNWYPVSLLFFASVLLLLFAFLSYRRRDFA